MEDAGLQPNQLLMDLPRCGTKAVVTIEEVKDDGQIKVEFQYLPVPNITAEMVEAEIGEIINASLKSHLEREEGDPECSTDSTPK